MMSKYSYTIGGKTYQFDNLTDLMAKASAVKSGDYLAGLAAQSDEQRVAAQLLLAETPLSRFVEEPLIAPESDTVSNLLMQQQNSEAFAAIALDTVGEFRDRLLSYETGTDELRLIAPGLLPEMAAAVSKIMRNQDLILVAGMSGFKSVSEHHRFVRTFVFPFAA